MYKKIALSLFILTAAAVTSSEVRAQRASVGADTAGPSFASTPVLDPLTMLPASDVIIDFNVRRVFSEALPRMLAKSPTKSAEMKRSLDKLEAMIGIDIRAVERIVIGGRVPAGGLAPNPGMNVPDGVIIVQGAFDAERLMSLANLSFGSRAVQQTYGGTSMHTWTLNNGVPQANLTPQMREISMTTLDRQTLVAGTPAGVRECLDVYHAGGSGGTNSDLIKLTTQNPAALIAVGFKLKPSTAARDLAGRVPGGAGRGLQLDGMDKFGTPPAAGTAGAGTTGNDSFTKMLESIEQVHASIGMTALALDALLIARTRTTEQAQELNEMVAGLRQMIESSFVKSSNTRRPLGNLDVLSDGNEVRIHMQMTHNEAASLVANTPATRGKAPATTPRARRSSKTGARR